MFGIIFLLSVLLLLIASYFDFKYKEVPDWIYLLLINLGLWFNLNLLNLEFFIFFFIFGYLLYYFDFWGGADSKLLFGIGTLIPTNFIYGKILFSSIFLLMILICCGILNRINKKKLELPFVPFILLSYLTMYICYFLITK